VFGDLEDGAGDHDGDEQEEPVAALKERLP
jgi:hypothetical protein